MQVGGIGGDVLRVERFGPRQMLMLAVGCVVMVCDGFDAQMMSATAPAIIADWHITRAALGPIFASNLAGLMVGALIITPFTDTRSRRAVIMGCIAAFSLLSILPVFATTLLQLGIARFATGLALGAAMPSVIAAVSEYVPQHLRTRIVVGLSCAFTAGFGASGAAAGLMMGRYGWHSVFWLGGLLPLLTLPMVAAWFPDSPTYLVQRGRVAELQALLRRMGPGLYYEPSARLQAKSVSSTVFALFQDGRSFVTLMVWLTFFCSGATLFFLANWLPILVSSAGYGVASAAFAGSVYQAGALTGGFVIGYLVDRWGVVALSAWLLAAAIAVAMMGPSADAFDTLLVAAFAAGFLVVGGQTTLNAYTGGSLYPSNIRATGLGWALGMVRLGGVLAGSLAAGFVVSLDLGPRNTFMVIGAPELVCAAALMAIHLRRGQVATPAVTA